MPNRNAEKLLDEHGYYDMEPVIDLLVEHGYIVDIPVTEPERLAIGARIWLGRNNPKEVFEKASGWSTESWGIVMKEKFDTPSKIKYIFPALVILAEDAKIDL